jgi:hypothetical protein
VNRSGLKTQREADTIDYCRAKLMQFRLISLFLVTSQVLAACLAGLGKEPKKGNKPATDRNGDPLPPGALARLGKFRSPEVYHAPEFETLAFSPDGKMLATGRRFRWIKVWEVRTGKQLRALKTDYVTKLFFLPDAKTLAIFDGSSLLFWDVTKGKRPRLLTLGETEHWPHPVALSPDGKLLAASGGRGKLYDFHLWDVARLRRTRSFTGHRGTVWDVVFAPDGKTLATGAWDGTARVWDMATGKQLRFFTMRRPNNWVMQVCFILDGKALATLSGETVNLWELATGKVFRSISDDKHRIQTFALSPDGHTLATGGMDGTVQLWEVASGKEIAVFRGHQGHVNKMAFAPDGRFLASGGQDCGTLIWQVLARNPKRRPVRLRPNELQARWTDLAAAQVPRAQRAVWELVESPALAVPFLRKRLRAAPAATPGKLHQWIAELDDNRYRVRYQATRGLTGLGRWAAPALRRKLAGQKVSPEARRRMEGILKKLFRAPPTADQLQAVRAVQALELIRPAEARKVLADFAKGPRDALVTQEAGAALKRLRRCLAQRP